VGKEGQWLAAGNQVAELNESRHDAERPGRLTESREDARARGSPADLPDQRDREPPRPLEVFRRNRARVASGRTSGRRLPTH
jgi:hypothetical protein